MIKRLVAFFVFAVSIVPSIGFAQTPTPDVYFGYNGNYFRTGMELCTFIISSRTDGAKLTGVGGGHLTGYNRGVDCMGTKPPGTTTIVLASGFWYSQCSNTQPYFDYAKKMCVSAPPPPSCPKDSPGKGVWTAGDSSGGAYTSVVSTGGCVNSCTVDIQEVEACYSYPPDKAHYCRYSWKTTGSTCAVGDGTRAESIPPPGTPTRTDVPPFTPNKSSCPAGTVQGGVSIDGTTPICIGTGSTPQNQPPPPPKIETSQTEATPDGGTKTTDTTVTRNSDGSSTTQTTTTTVDPNGVKTIVVTKDVSSNTENKPGKDESNREDDKYDLCKSNPMLNICRNSSVSGSCGEVTCMGDAIQCATLRAAAAMQCEQQADKEALQASPSKALGDQVLSGNDPMKGDIATALKGTEVDLSKTALDQGGFVGGGSCFPDKTFMVVGKTVTVSFARVCQDIQPLRAAIMACAFIIAYLIVGRSVVQG